MTDLPFSSAQNLRDLGGIRVAGGGVVRTGRMYRSEYPGFAAQDPAVLRLLGVTTVVDLRRGTEAAAELVDWPGRGVRWHRWPLSAGAADSWHARYRSYLEHRPETVVGAVREIMRAAPRGVLFHCAAGKDRTGVVAALLLTILGVDAEEVVEDYLASSASVPVVLARLRGHPAYAAMLADATDEDQRPQEEAMRSFLAWLEGLGGADGWLRARGVPAAEVAAFRSAMVVAEG